MRWPLLLAWTLVAPSASAQGYFWFANWYGLDGQRYGAPTRLGSIDGPLAGRGIWAQMLVGETIYSLVPTGAPAEHLSNGWVNGGTVFVADVHGTTAMVQMAAWDGRLWGTNLAGVPADQLGRTDTVPVLLDWPPGTPMAPRFTQPAIVPIPEPAVWALATLGCGLLVGLRFRQRWRAAVGQNLNARRYRSMH